MTISLLAALVGLCIGSFLNVVIHRLPKMMERSWKNDVIEVLRSWSEQIDFIKKKDHFLATAAALENEAKPAARYNLVVPGSSCPSCGHKIRAWENIPVISYLLLRGRCAACRAPISIRYPLVEAATAILSFATAWQFGYTVQLAGALIVAWSLVALTMIDIDTQLLPDSITLPLLWLGLLFNMQETFVPVNTALIGAVAGYLSLWSVYWLFKLLTGKEGMGYGDFKLLAALGAWLGWLQLPVIVLAASISGLVFAVVQMMGSRLGWGQRFPFGPYLAAGGLISLFWGKEILRWYLGS